MLACRVPSRFWQCPCRALSTFIHSYEHKTAFGAPSRASPKLDTKTQSAIIEEVFHNNAIPVPQDGIPLWKNFEQANLLDTFGLSRIPRSNQNNHGVKIDEMGQLQIICQEESRQKHKTALILSRAPRSLVERDFVRVLGSGKHIEGWKSRSGLEQIFPMRFHDTLQRLTAWVLVFATPASAKEYQERAHHLRKLVRNNIPTSHVSKIAPPPNYTVGGVHGFTLNDYTLTTPWQRPMLFAQLAPFESKLQRAIDIHTYLVSLGRDGDEGFPVRVWVDQHNLLSITAELLERLLLWDGRVRGSLWRIAQRDYTVAPLTGQFQRRMILGDGEAWLGTKDVSNWFINFQSASEARRFVRLWHRRQLPKFSQLPFSDPQPLIKAECLFNDSGVF